MKTKALIFLLVLVSGLVAIGADPQPADAARLEQRWQSIQPELFAGDAGKRHVGTLVRFRAGASTQSVAGSLVTIKSKDGTIQVSNVSKAARRDIATPHIPLTTVTVEGTITGIDPAKQTVFIKATKVDVSW